MSTVLQEPHIHLWTRHEFEKMDETGFFANTRVELINGRVFEMPPMKPAHATSLSKTSEVLGQILPAGCHVRQQAPLNLGIMDEPFPDFAVVFGDVDTYAAEHPVTALLVIEVSDSTLVHDRTEKFLQYAQAGIPEYWIVNLVDRQLEIFRDPQHARYLTQIVIREMESIAPLFAADNQISVSALLPK
jgi:Uma2 family endonuclease